MSECAGHPCRRRVSCHNPWCPSPSATESAAAEAWDEGWEAGYADHLRWMQSEASNEATPNPYREREAKK